MTKNEFIFKLKSKLSNLPKEEVDERINFYIEMIDDRVEEGFTEEQAVVDIGPIDNIAEQIVSDIPLFKALKSKIKRNRAVKGWSLALLIIGSPVWFSLLISAFAVVLSLYVSLWAVVISLWAVVVSLAVSSGFGVVFGIVHAFKNFTVGLCYIGLGIACIGLTIFFYYGCLKITKWSAILIKKIVLSVKKKSIKGDE